MITEQYIPVGETVQKKEVTAGPVIPTNMRFVFRFAEQVLEELSENASCTISSAQMFEIKNTFEVVLRSVLLDLNISAIKVSIVDEHYQHMSVLASMRYGNDEATDDHEPENAHKRLNVLRSEAPTNSRHAVPIAYYVHRIGTNTLIEGISDLEFTGYRILLSFDAPTFTDENDNRDAVIGYVRYCKRILDDWWSYSSFSRTNREFSIESFKKDIKKRSFVKSWNPAQAIAEAKVRFM